MAKRNPTPPAEDETNAETAPEAKETAPPETQASEKVDPPPVEEAPDLAGDEVETPASIRVLCKQLSSRIGAVMAVTGKRPGNLVAMQNELNTMASTEHPLMDCTDSSITTTTLATMARMRPTSKALPIGVSWRKMTR